ncbi:cytochrome c-type biogenesis protein CcmH [Streptosporangium sandarakinum]|uniref:cytochrome c-type biogenesis protein CcmH n=1 Tax=Streptosporangium sandarakinum TaxID=1260955 RepID=UPI0035E40F32
MRRRPAPSGRTAACRSTSPDHIVDRPVRRRLAVAGLIVLVALACAAVWRAGRSEPALGERVMEVAAMLRCPDCQGLSAAESPSKLAGAMRAEIGRRLTRGRSSTWCRSRSPVRRRSTQGQTYMRRMTTVGKNTPGRNGDGTR